MDETERMADDAKRIAEDIRVEELERRLSRLSDFCSALDDRLVRMRREVLFAKELSEESADESEEASIGSAEQSFDLGDDKAYPSIPPHAYQVTTTPDGKVFCLLPKNPDGSYFPAAQGGKHLGSSGGVTADEHAGPYPAGGEGSSSDEPSPWARYGWCEVSGALDVSSGAATNDKLVIAKFSVPRDPPESQRTSGTEVQGPQLTEMSLVDSSGWKSHASQTWKEFDASGTEPVTREVAIAHLANGLVTQLTMTPFISLGGGTGDDWHPDSECEKFLSLDPMNEHACPDYETEEYQDTEQRQVGTDLQGNPIMREVTVTKTRVKTDQQGNPIQKTDASGNPLYLEPKHQVHNFESGNDGGDTTYDAEYNRTEELVAVRVPKEGGGAELFWRHVKFSQDAPCPPVIDVTEPVRSGNYVVFYVDVYEGAKVGGVCTSGQRIQHKEVAIPIINPELALQEKCVITGVQVGSGGITFQRESVLCVAGSGTCQPVTIEAEACENA